MFFRGKRHDTPLISSPTISWLSSSPRFQTSKTVCSLCSIPTRFEDDDGNSIFTSSRYLGLICQRIECSCKLEKQRTHAVWDAYEPQFTVVLLVNVIPFELFRVYQVLQGNSACWRRICPVRVRALIRSVTSFGGRFLFICAFDLFLVFRRWRRGMAGGRAGRRHCT